jgi:hypothetical protein
MHLNKPAAVALAALIVTASLGPAVAGKKKPKPYTSEEGIIAVPHTMLNSTTGEVNSVTAREFEARCEIPASNGLDAYVYEVPKAYQKIEAEIAARANASIAWDLYVFFYTKDCVRAPYSLGAQGSVTQADVEGPMPKGTAFVLIADFAGEPTTVYYELKPL